MFGVGMTEAMVVGGRSGGPNGTAAGMTGAAVVTTEGAGVSTGLGGASGMPGDSGVAIESCGDARKKLLAICAISAGSGQDGADGIDGFSSQMAGDADVKADPRLDIVEGILMIFADFDALERA